jgi:filamentous hemagglutinin
VDAIKLDMLQGNYHYGEPHGRIGGWLDSKGVYYVGEGHHRMAAAQEVYRETGDATAVLELLKWGEWTKTERPPSGSRPLPARAWWGKFRNWLGF